MDDLNSTETLADRLNSEPVIFRGSSSSELSVILIAAILFWLPVSLVVAALLGAVAMGLGFSSVGIFATIYYGSTLFQKIKRGRPDNYYQHRLMILFDRLGLRGAQLIRRTGAWSLGRTFYPDP